MRNSFIILLQQELHNALRHVHTSLTSLFFFIIIVSLFAFTVGNDATLLHSVAPAIVWVSALLSVLLSIHSLFKQEMEEGTLETLLLSPHSLTLLISIKLIAHWLSNSLPLICITPILGLLLHFTAKEEITLFITLLLGTPILTLLGSIAAALLVGIQHHGALLPVLIMPLYIPVLIFGTGTVITAGFGQPINGHLALLSALFLLCIGFLPWLTSVALRIGVNQ